MVQFVFNCRASSLACAAFAAMGLVANLPATARADDQPAPQAAPDLDAATKQLMAANGLFQRGLFQLASQGYTDFLDKNPNHPKATAARYALAICYYRLSDGEKAVKELTTVLANPAFTQRDEALAVLGQCELTQKHFDKALAAMDELLAKYPSSKHAELASLGRVQALYLAGKKADAIDAGQKFMTAYPKSAQLPADLYFLASAEHDLGQNDKVIETAAQIEKNFPDSPYRFDATLLLAQAMDATGKLDFAIDVDRQLVSNAPEARRAEAHYALGLLLYKAGKFEESGKEMSAVIAAAPAGDYAALARLQLGLAQLAAGHPGDARAPLVEMAKDPAHANDANYALAQCDIAEKKYDAARQRLGDLLQIIPPVANAAQISLDRADCLINKGNFKEAAGEYAAVFKQYPDSPLAGQAIYRQAVALNRAKNFDESHAVLVQFANRPASDLSPAAAELDAENLFSLSKYAEASKAFAALAAANKDPQKQALLTLRQGQCAYFAGDYAKAAEILGPLAADSAAAQSDELRPAIFLLGDAFLQLGNNSGAAATLARYIAVTKPDADTLEARFKLGLAQIRGGDAKAADTLNKVAQGPVDSPWVQRALLELGQLYYKAKQPQQAGDAMNKLVAAKPPADLAAPAAYLLGWLDFDAKKFPEAAARWDTIARDYPKQSVAADAEYNRGIALKEMGKFDEATTVLQSFASAHADSPNAITAKQLAADCLAKQGKADQASAILASLANDPKAGDSVLYDLAWSQRNAKDNATAEQTYKRLIKDHPDSKLAPVARAELAELLYNDKQYQPAIDLLVQVKPEDGIDPKVVSGAAYRLAWCFDKLGQFDKAANGFATLAENEKDHPALAASALLQAANDYALQDKFDPAEKSLNQFLKEYPANPMADVALLKLGEVQAELNNYDGSAATYKSFMEKYPTDKLTYRANFGIGWSLENRKKYSEARDAYQKVIAADNGETAARAQFQIGETLLVEKQFEKAIAAFLAVDDVYAYPAWAARALLEAGHAFEQLKQVDQAKAQYNQVIKKYKDRPEAELAQQRLKALG